MAELPPDASRTLARQHGLITRAQLARCGASSRNIGTYVRRRLILPLRTGVYVDTSLWEAADPRMRHLLQVTAALMVAPDAAAWSESAAIAFGLPVRDSPTRPTLVRAPGRSVLTGADVTRRNLPADAVGRHGHLQVTTIPQTIVDLTRTRPLHDALIPLDAALRRGVTQAQIRSQLQRLSGSKGHRRAELATSYGDPAAESPMESLSRGRMITGGLPLPLVNVVIRSLGRTARVDVLWVRMGVVGECDGRSKYLEAATASDVIWKEKRRHEWIEDQLLEVFRWGYPEIANDGAALISRYNRAVRRQQQAKFQWPAHVRIEVPSLAGCELPQRAAAQIRELQADGYPIFAADRC